MLIRFCEWYITRRARSVDELLYSINRLCFAILARTAEQRQRQIANKIMQDVGKAARVLERKNGHSFK